MYKKNVPACIKFHTVGKIKKLLFVTFRKRGILVTFGWNSHWVVRSFAVYKVYNTENSHIQLMQNPVFSHMNNMYIIVLWLTNKPHRVGENKHSVRSSSGEIHIIYSTANITKLTVCNTRNPCTARDIKLSWLLCTRKKRILCTFFKSLHCCNCG